jgi:hypothetical protein
MQPVPPSAAQPGAAPAAHKICNACETVEHCTRHGCIPVQPLTRIDRLPAPRQAASVDLVKAAAPHMLAALEEIHDRVAKGCTEADWLAIAVTARVAIDLAKGFGK